MSAAKILVVDDEIIIARELEARLTGLGYAVCGVAGSGAEAIELCRATHPDLVLMDIVLKGAMDGIEAATEIRSQCHTPVIYVTAYTDDKTLERAAVTEPFAYIVKPFTEREIRANIEMALYKHRMETRLRRIEHWFGGITHDDTVAVIVSDLEGTIRSFNRCAELITAWPREKAIGSQVEHVLQLVNKGNGKRINLYGEQEGPIVNLSTETVLIDKAKTEVPVDCTTTVLRDPGDRPIGRISVFRDNMYQRNGALVALTSDVSLAVAESLSLQGMLQLCAESLVRNLNAAFARVWTLDPSGRSLILRASAGCYTRTDGEFSKIEIGAGKIGYIAQERKPHLTNDVQHDARIRDPEWARKEGMVAFAGFPLMVGNKLVGVMAMFGRMPFKQSILDALDSIARTIAVGVERKRLEDQVRYQHKMEALGKLAGGVAHDFNNLLTLILGNSTSLMESIQSDTESRKLAMEIAETAERAGSLTHQLLAFGRRQLLDECVHDLNGIVSELERMLNRIIGEDIALQIELGNVPAKVFADRSQLEQMIVNLVVNARDAMPRGGKITVEVRESDIDASFVHGQSDIAPGKYILLCVSDNGEGMSREVQARIFEPYFTTKDFGKGTGLGLATVYGIVRQSGGYVHVYSELGLGSTFKVYLPQSNEAPTVVQRPVRKEQRRGSETVLVVEDDEYVRAMCKRILEGSGYHVLAASSGEEAYMLAKNYDPEIHIVVTDVVLPGLNGKDLLERMLVGRPALKCVYMSGYTDEALSRHGIKHASDVYLAKPFGASELTRTVRETLDTGVEAV